jgi:hypothetical protein
VQSSANGDSPDDKRSLADRRGSRKSHDANPIGVGQPLPKSIRDL